MGMVTELWKVFHLNNVYIQMDAIKTVNRQDMKSFGMVFIRKKNKRCLSTGYRLSELRVVSQ